MKIILILVASLISATLYRLGGIGKPFDTKYRDLGCPLVFLGLFWGLQGFKLAFWWVYLTVFLLTFGALTTYWDKLFKKDNFWFSGFMVGLAAFPLYWLGFPWYLILIRAILLGILWGYWCKIFSRDWVEETFRGGTISLTVPLLMVYL